MDIVLESNTELVGTRQNSEQFELKELHKRSLRSIISSKVSQDNIKGNINKDLVGFMTIKSAKKRPARILVN
jgi:hypothetical protein